MLLPDGMTSHTAILDLVALCSYSCCCEAPLVAVQARLCGLKLDVEGVAVGTFDRSCETESRDGETPSSFRGKTGGLFGSVGAEPTVCWHLDLAPRASI